MNRSAAWPFRPVTPAAGAPLRLAAGVLFALAILIAAAPATAQTPADEDLPGRVGRVAEVAGELFLSPSDAPDQWAPIGINYPVTGGDNLWVGNDGRAEIDFGAGQFRLASNTNLHLSRLDDRQFALFVAQGRVSVRVRVLDAGEVAQVDTPNGQIVLTRPGLYRIDVSDDRERTLLAVREGEAYVQTAGGNQQVLPGQNAEVAGADPRYAEVRNGLGRDGFDAWVADRDRRYTRSRANNYVSREMVGWADLEEHGTWSQAPEIGAVWYPNDVAPDWAPYRNGYWAQVGGWGPTWVDYSPWGYAPFHYGRWAYVRGRWGWAPGTYVVRPFWAPALVGWTGGAAWSYSVSSGAPVYGWVPLGWGEAYRPWWGRCSDGCWQRYNRPYAVNVAVRSTAPPVRYINREAPGGMTAMPAAAFVARRPVSQNMVTVSGGMAAQAPSLSSAPIVRTDLGRIPVSRSPGGAPPPASTFYRTGVNPAPGGGISSLPGAGVNPAAGGGIGSLPGAGATAASPEARPAPTAATPMLPSRQSPSGGISGLSRPESTVVAVPPASRSTPPSGGSALVVAPSSAPVVRSDGRSDLRGSDRPPAPTSVAPLGMSSPSTSAPGTSPGVAPAQPYGQRAPTRPSVAPAYVAPAPVAAMPSMPPVARAAPAPNVVPGPAPQVVRPAPAPQTAPAPMPAPAQPTTGNMQRTDRRTPDKVDQVDKVTPK